MSMAIVIMDEARHSRLYDELRFALVRTDSAALRRWGKRAAARLVLLTARRVGGLVSLIAGLARFGGREFLGFVRALLAGEGGRHFGQRSAAAIDAGIVVSREGRRIALAIGSDLLRDPKRTAPKLIGTVLGLGTGSGGLDGNGGVPDLDLLAGIGYHRSPLTHTIIAAIVLEGLLLALIDLATEVHQRLPHDHDPLWDDLARIGRPFAESASIGLSAGIAYHLLVDAFVQPGTYHGMPFHMSADVHHGLFAANGVAEGADATRRASKGGKHKRGVLLEGTSIDTGPSTGERVVAGATDAMREATVHVKGKARSFVHWARTRASKETGR